MDALTISIISIVLIFAGTTLGSAVVFFFKKNFSDSINTAVLGFASGVMISASVFGLILPAIEEASNQSVYRNWSYVPILVGFLLGCLLLYFFDKLIPHFHQASQTEEGLHNEKISKQTKFFLAVTMHNIPEGLAVGFAAGLALSSQTQDAIFSLLALSIAIALQNIPEGAAVSVPYLGLGVSKTKSFFLGSLSGIVEPVFAVIGLFVASWLTILMPWLLAFAAGMMIYVTLDEILPESINGHLSHLGVWSFIVGFMIMLLLEILL